MVKVEVIIPTYNRPELILKCLDSVLCQTYFELEIIVSDNSTNNVTENLFNDVNDPRVKFKRREVHLSGIEHLNLILSEVKADLFIIFHDDDLMEKNMIERLASYLSINNNILAVGCNAFIMREKKSSKKLFGNFKLDIILNNPLELIDSYFNSKKFVPFPSYLYRQSIATCVKLNELNGGKYCDLSFLNDILSFGKIAFIADPLMNYFIHKGQDTANHKFLEKISLIKYLCKANNLTTKHLLIRKIRVENIYMELKIQFQHINSDLSDKKQRLYLQYILILKYLGVTSFLKVIFFSVKYFK
jgi:GT2 family glycosyltransferase